MDTSAKLISDFASPYWWVTVVVVGLLINLVSAYLKNPIDQFFSKSSQWWRKRSAARTDRFNAEVQYLSSSQELLTLSMLNELRDRLRCILYALIIITVFVAAYLVEQTGFSFVNQLRRPFSIALEIAGALMYLVLLATLQRSLHQTEINNTAAHARRRRGA